MNKSLSQRVIFLVLFTCLFTIFWSPTTRSDEVTLTSSSQPAGHYQMISIPLEASDVLEVFGDDLGPYDPKIWRIFRYDSETGQNLEYPDVPLVSPGIAYWLITRDGGAIDATGRLATDETYSLSIPPGWFQLGNPYNAEVLKSTLQVTLTETATTSITVPLSDPASPIEDALWSYVNGAYVMTDRMVPWEGYYIYNLGVSPVTLLIPNPSPVSGEGSLQVTVVDALTGDSLEGVTVTLNGFTATTDTLGIATLSDTPSGTFTLTVSKSGYITHQQEITLEVGPNDLIISLSPQLATGQIRIVLNWGATPSDLDSHLTGPNASGGRFHVYFADENPAGAGANLDLDDVTSFGPETITITELRSGTYKYYIHDFSNQSNSSSTALAQSGARVDVYGESGLIASSSVPSGAGTIWHVLNIDGGTGSVTPVNTLSSGEVPLDSMLSDGSGEEMGFEGIEMEDIFRNLPPKSD